MLSDCIIVTYFIYCTLQISAKKPPKKVDLVFFVDLDGPALLVEFPLLFL